MNAQLMVPSGVTTVSAEMPLDQRHCLTRDKVNFQSAFIPGPHHVVVVDDDPDIRILLTHVLRTLHIKTHVFSDGDKVLDNLDKVPCDLMLIDYQLPRMTGLDLTRAIRSTYPLLPVALITGRAHLVTPEAVAAVGIGKVFPKPFDLDDLIRWIQDQMGVK